MLPREGDAGDEPPTKDDAAGGGDTGDADGMGGEYRSVYGRWRGEALKIKHMSGPPDWRHVPMLTPPIPGFDPSLYMDQEEDK